MRDNVEVLDVRYLLIQGCQLVEVRCKEAKRVNFRRDVSAHTRDQPEKVMTHEDDVLGDGPSQPEPIVCRCSAPEFVNDDERVLRCALWQALAPHPGSRSRNIP